MKWWNEAVVYQVYPRSFMDSNNDGIGDLKGIISKLEYIKYLGANVIWLSPVYESPNDDNGYDISDYYNIMNEFGTMKDMDNLIFEAEKNGIKIVMDLVANHTSVKHEWFVKGSNDKNSKYHDYYYFKDNTGVVPNQLQSIFLGSAWELTDNKEDYYLHMFAKSQADLNWHNKNVRNDLYKMINWWLNKGIGGFRLDVIDMIAKDIDNNIIGDGPLLHDYIKELANNTFKKYDVMTVGETWGADSEKAIKYSNNDGSELSMIFNFSHILLDQNGEEKWDYKKLNLLDLKSNFEERQLNLHNKGWDALFWNDHDLPRIISRWGDDDKYRVESAKMFGTLLHFMQGTPYVYQGEEIGMTNVTFNDINEYKDIETINMYNDRIKKGYEINEIMKSIQHIGRDNARTPMQWNDKLNAGFSENKPWIKVNPNYTEINVASQINNPESILNYYKKLIDFRRFSKYKDLIRDGNFELTDRSNSQIFSYKRIYKDKIILVICNFTDCVINYSYDKKNVILCNYKDQNGIYLRPYEALVIDNLSGIKK
jgi:glycosidase